MVLGDSKAGKTALLNTFVYGCFHQSFLATNGADLMTKEILLDDRVVKLQMWDTAGQERFKTIGAAILRHADCCLLVYDVTSRGSFELVRGWRDKVRASEHRGALPFVVAGNKAEGEAEREVGWSEAQTWARSNGDPLFETSAKDYSNVKEVFEQAARLAVQRLNNAG